MSKGHGLRGSIKKKKGRNEKERIGRAAEAEKERKKKVRVLRPSYRPRVDNALGRTPFRRVLME